MMEVTGMMEVTEMPKVVDDDELTTVMTMTGLVATHEDGGNAPGE